MNKNVPLTLFFKDEDEREDFMDWYIECGIDSLDEWCSDRGIDHVEGVLENEDG